MGRSPCCDKVGLKKGPWTPEEDQKLLAYIQEHGHGSWRALPTKAGLLRCGKSCRLRWTNYLRPDIKRGQFNLQEEQTIIRLHALLGNRWSSIAAHLPKRTDNEIKNYWNTHLKKRLAKIGIDPTTHKPKPNTLMSMDGQSKHAANLSHMAQWETARLEAEARLARQSKIRSNSFQNHLPEFFSSSSDKPVGIVPPPRSFDILKSWNGSVSVAGIGGADLESPTSTLSCSEIQHGRVLGENSTAFIEIVRNSSEGKETSCKAVIESSDFMSGSGLPETTIMPEDRTCAPEQIEYFEDNKNYWNSILNVVNSSPVDSPVFEWEFSS